MKPIVALCAAAGLSMAGAAGPAQAQTGPEVYLGGFAHDVSDGFVGTPHEDGTVDVEVGVRSRRYTYFNLVKLNWYGKAEVNTSGLSSFYTFGFELRKHLFTDKFYIGGGAGVTYDAGLRAYKNPFDPGISEAEYLGRLHTQQKWKAMGSDVLFNPNILVGYELSPHWALEGAWDHYSHATLLGKRNPGIDNFGGRLVYRFGAR
jgi:lipid A 3-O-deacylase